MSEEPKTEKGQEKMPDQTNKIIPAVIIVVAVIGGIFYFSRSRYQSPARNASRSDAGGPIGEEQAVKTFGISARPFEFSVKEIRVKKGDRVRINLTVAQGMHDWVVDEFNARTNVIQAGASDSVEFVADKAGIFEYYCSVPTHRQQGMAGKLIVE